MWKNYYFYLYTYLKTSIFDVILMVKNVLNFTAIFIFIFIFIFVSVLVIAAKIRQILHYLPVIFGCFNICMFDSMIVTVLVIEASF